MEEQLTLSVKCPYCNRSFMDKDYLINEEPAIKVSIETNSGKGTLYLCSVYGCFKHKSTIKLKDDEAVKMFCPHCHESLMRDVLCKNCGSPIVGFNIDVGGKVNICSKKGCQNHYILFEDANDLINLFYDKFQKRY